MRLTLLNPAPLAVAILQPGADKFFNWATTGWESPWDPAKHARPMVPMEPAGLWGGVQTLDLGPEVCARQDVVVAILTVDPGAGSPTYTLLTLASVTQGDVAAIFTRG